MRQVLYWLRWSIALPVSLVTATLAFVLAKESLFQGERLAGLDSPASLLVALGISNAIGGAVLVVSAFIIAPSHKNCAANAALAVGLVFVSYVLWPDMQRYSEGHWWTVYSWGIAITAMTASAFGVNRLSRR